MSDSNIIITDRESLKDLTFQAVKEALLAYVPDAIREANKAKWLHRDTVKARYGLTDRQLQYLRDERKVEYTQRRRRIWYLRESIEAYYEEGRVNASS